MTTKQKSDKSDDEEDEKPRGGQAQMMQSMTTIMPIMFGFFSLSFSVGLSIYFVTSNLIGIVQYSPQGRKVLDKLFRKKQTDDRPWRLSSRMTNQSRRLENAERRNRVRNDWLPRLHHQQRT